MIVVTCLVLWDCDCLFVCVGGFCLLVGLDGGLLQCRGLFCEWLVVCCFSFLCEFV